MTWVDIRTKERMTRQQYRRKKRDVLKTGGWMVAMHTETMQTGITLSAEAREHMAMLASVEGLSVEEYLYRRFVEQPAEKALQRCGYAA